MAGKGNNKGVKPDKSALEARDRAEACGLTADITQHLKQVPLRWSKIEEKARRLLNIADRRA